MGLHVVVLAGGSGTRLWPLSRAAVPKHLLPLGGAGRSLLAATVERVQGLDATVWVVTVADQAERCAGELAAAGGDPARLIAEPAARGTGPALGLAMRWILRDDPEAVVCSVHADHHVGDAAGYRTALWEAAGWAVTTGALATVGVPPTYPATGFGYVALGPARNPAEWRPPVTGAESPGGAPAAHLEAHVSLGFVEKPPLADAQRFAAGDSHLWNTGLFAWNAATFLDELRAASDVVDRGLAAVVAARADGDEAAATAAYLDLPSVPVDTLVLERTRNLTVVRAAFDWSDLGSWADLAAARSAAGEADAAGNVVAGDALVVGSTGCLVESRGGRLVAVVGAEGLVVVDAGDAVLVVPADRAQEVKHLVERLRAAGRQELV